VRNLHSIKLRGIPKEAQDLTPRPPSSLLPISLDGPSRGGDDCSHSFTSPGRPQPRGAMIASPGRPQPAGAMIGGAVRKGCVAGLRII
jgi:hypothetical protein